MYDARTGEGSARRVDAATVNLTVTAPGGRLDGIGVALLYAETRDQLTRVEWIGGTEAFTETTGAITITGSALADALHIATVAEGIEDARQVPLLVAMGCSSGQGYHFGRPVPAERFGQLLAAQGEPAPLGGR